MRFAPSRLALTFVSCCAALAVAVPNARADSPRSMFTLSGFGTFGVTHSSLDTADFSSTSLEPRGAGASHKIDVADDTKVGVQLNAQFTSKLSALVQVVAHNNFDNTFTPTLEWANLNYAFTPDLNVRIGRIELPTFLASDYREVGYANPWVRVPRELYSIEPITNSDGIDASYRAHLGSVTNTIRLVYGYTTFSDPSGFKSRVSAIFGAFDTFEYRALTGRVGYMRARVKLPFASDAAAAIYSAGANFDMERWFVQAEIARVTAAGLTPGYLSGYATAGVRINRFTPYVTYAQEYSLNHPLNIPNYNRGQKDLSAGLRWDFAKNVDLKVQYDHVWTPANSTGLFINEQPNFRLGSGANVVTAALDFVF